MERDDEMIRSMTGFGRSEIAAAGHRLTVEIKSVNHRYLDLSIKMPRLLNEFESLLRGIVRERVQRGKVDMYVTYESEGAQPATVTYNEALAAEYINHIRNISETFGLRNDMTASSLSRMPDVFTVREEEMVSELLKDTLTEALNQALDAFLAARELEGEKLKNDLEAKLLHLEELVAQVVQKAPSALTAYREKLLERMKEVLAEQPVDETRIAAEAAIYADKVCVDEEMVRLRTHIGHMLSELRKGDGVGRKLDFLTQEMNREANTTLSKVNDASLADIAIEMKTEIEKIREQVQNIE